MYCNDGHQIVMSVKFITYGSLYCHSSVVIAEKAQLLYIMSERAYLHNEATCHGKGWGLGRGDSGLSLEPSLSDPVPICHIGKLAGSSTRPACTAAVHKLASCL